VPWRVRWVSGSRWSKFSRGAVYLGGMPQSLANYDAALKNIYAPGLRNAINYSNPILTEVVKDTENFSGRNCIWGVHSGRSNSTGARAEFGTLPVADRQRYLAPQDTLAYLYHTVKVSGQAKHLTQNDAGAFARALDTEMTGAEKDIKTDLARQMFNRAVTINSVLINGSIATVNGAPAANVITIDDGSATYANITRPFFVGMVIDSVNPATGAIRQAGMTITTVTSATPSVTVDASGATADNDEIFRAGNFAATSTENEVNGLRFLLGTQNYAGITAASNPVWNGNAVGSSSEGISENLLESAIEKVQVDGSGDTPTLAIAEHSQGRKLASIIQQQKRYAPPSVTLEAGWKGVDVAGLTLVFDRFCPSYRIPVVTPDQLAWFVGLDWTWDDDDGKVLYKALDGSDAVEARFKAYVNLQTYVRNAHTLVTLADPAF
jgi:hypothetical protein